MFNEKYILKKEKESRLNEIIAQESEKYYMGLKSINEGREKIFFISIISNISISLFDFYIDINRTNNVFYNNINKINDKLLKNLYKLDSSYLIIKYIETNNVNGNCDIIIKRLFNIFNYSSKDKKMFRNLHTHFKKDKVGFNLGFVFLFAKKVFNTDKQNAMEFAYINYYLENLYKEFYENYIGSVLEVV